ncbi:MAG TPA: hypothetical protein G4N95_04755 [Anaerolineae bacterium]|nr:hypothetical protein [Anaerolineae bacterium]
MTSPAFFTFFFLFYFQLLTDFIAAIYAFGLLGTGIPPELGFILLLFTPVLLSFFRKRIPRLMLLILGWIALLSRAFEPMLDTRTRMIVAGIGVGALLIFLPGFLWWQTRQKSPPPITEIGTGLLFAILLSILFRTWGAGVDVTTQSGHAWMGWLLSVLAIPMLYRAIPQSKLEKNDEKSRGVAPFGRILLLSLGTIATLTMLYFTFTTPQLLSRWRGEQNDFISILLIIISLTATGVLLTFRKKTLQSLTTKKLLIGNLLFTIVLLFTILPFQFHFPSQPSTYPFYPPPIPGIAIIPIILLPLLSPILILDFLFLYGELHRLRPTLRQLGYAFTLSSLFLLIILFAHIFTSVYDYIPIVGPFFRDKFWLVYLILALTITVTSLIARPENQFTYLPHKYSPKPGIIVPLLSLIFVLTIAGYFVTIPHAQTPSGEINHLRVMTYNIQQGYSEDGQFNVDGQIALIKSIDPDILAIEESDSARIANANNDLVAYFAKNLNMNSYYGPNSVVGTFGIALLSKYPIQNPHTFYMFSKGEQTAAIQAQISVNNQTFNIFATHLGNGGPIIQQEQVLAEVDTLPNVILMGDFNFRPDTPQYELTGTILEDAWLLRGRKDSNNTGVNPQERIDHIFVSPSTLVLDCHYVRSTASDHPAMWAEIGW